jgi:hypothetical protein
MDSIKFINLFLPLSFGGLHFFLSEMTSIRAKNTTNKIPCQPVCTFSCRADSRQCNTSAVDHTLSAKPVIFLMENQHYRAAMPQQAVNNCLMWLKCTKTLYSQLLWILSHVLPKDFLKRNEKPFNCLKNKSCLKSCGILQTTTIEDAGETWHIVSLGYTV